jgi:hypothetical protein
LISITRITASMSTGSSPTASGFLATYGAALTSGRAAAEILGLAAP